jgi:hypothetical protein
MSIPDSISAIPKNPASAHQVQQSNSITVLGVEKSIWHLFSAPETWSVISVGKTSSIQNSSSSFAYVDVRAAAVTIG